jgi:hypothetical protein
MDDANVSPLQFGGWAVRKLIVVSTLLVILLSLIASLAGALSYGRDHYRTFITVRGEGVEVLDVGIYRYSARNLVAGGRPWDFVRLVVGIPILTLSFILHLRGSLRGTVLFIGSLASFFYQYMLWTFAWAYNSLFLAYVALFSLSLSSLGLVLAGVDRARVKEAIRNRFPLKATATFSFAVGVILLLKCLGETLPGVGSGMLPGAAAGYYTLVDQALDIGLLAPFCVLTGVLLLRRSSLGYLLSASSLVMFLCIGLSVVAGEAMLGASTGRTNVVGIAIFLLFLTAALCLLVAVIASIRTSTAAAK